MKRYLIKFLILSFSLGCIVSCAPYRDLEKFDDDSKIARFSNGIRDISKPSIYTAQLNFFKHSFDGLFIIKKEDTDKFRFAFTTKFGLRIFDFQIENNQLEKQYCIEQLDKKMVLSIFDQFFKILIAEFNKESIDIKHKDNSILIVDLNQKPEYLVYCFNNKSSQLEQIEKYKRSKMKLSAIFSDYKNNLPGIIDISHNKYNITLSLKSIQ